MDHSYDFDRFYDMDSEEEDLNAKKHSTQDNFRENKSEFMENRFKRSRERLNFSKYKSYSSKNSMIKGDSDLHSYIINSNNFFNPFHHEYVARKKSKIESANQSSNMITTSQINSITYTYNKYRLYPLEFFENNRFKLINSCGYRSEAGLDFNKTPKINQDCYLIKENIFGYKNFYLLSVLDGHGTHGHFISNYVKNFIKTYFTNPALYNENFTEKDLNEENLSLYQIYDIMTANNYENIYKCYKMANKNLKTTKYEISFSGTTANTILIIGNKIIDFNCGDSRSIIIIDHHNQAVPLSKDHKPNLEEEKIRIEKKGGKVEKYIENGKKIGPYRVWKKNEAYPGLAMSRSLGDFVASKIGVIAEPDIFEYEMNPFTRSLIIASDGVWEFLTNKQVLDIVERYYDSNDAIGAANKIVETARRCWKKEENTVDDITCIVLFFDTNSYPNLIMEE